MNATLNFKFANQTGYSDVTPYEVMKVVSEKTIEVRRMKFQETEESRKARQESFQVGGFVGHTDNDVQKWDITSDETENIERIRLNKKGEWMGRQGKFRLEDKPCRFYDFNF